MFSVVCFILIPSPLHFKVDRFVFSCYVAMINVVLLSCAMFSSVYYLLVTLY